MHLVRSARPRSAIVVAVAALFASAVGCGDDEGTVAGDTTTTSAPTTTTVAPTTVAPTSTTTTQATASTTSSTSPTVAPAAVDPAWPRYDQAWIVTGVDRDDTLNVRRGPGVSEPVVHELAPDADDVVVFDRVELVDGQRWGAVAVPGGAGWVNLVFVRPPGTNPPVVQGDVNPRTETAADDIQATLGMPDRQRLASLVDQRGVVLSTDAFVHDSDPVLSAEQLFGAAQDDSVLVWGHTDGEGAPIEMTIAERLDQIARDYALTSTDVIGFDTRVGTGNTIDNIAERFPGSSVVEYHFEGTSLHGHFDWSSVRFVFDTSVSGRPVLLAIVQDTWTI